MRIIPAQYVKPYVKTNKSDFIDAEAIGEAVARPTMRFVPIKTDDQLDMQSLHRVRERWVIRRTAVVNQIRGLLLERGITLRQGRRHLEAALPGILEDATTRLSGALRMLISQLKHELEELANFIGEADGVMERTSGENESCRRLLSIPGIGTVTATALIAAIGNGALFGKAESSQPGSAWCRENPPPEESRSFWASANEAIPTCESSSSRELARSCFEGPNNPSAFEHGSRISL